MNFQKSILFVMAFFAFSIKATAENRIPFVYLNQYYPFSIKNDHEINLSTATINFDKFAVVSDTKTISIDLKSFKILPPAVQTYLIVRDKVGADIGSKAEVSIKKPLYSLPNHEGSEEICLIQNSNFTKLELCKKLHTDSLMPEKSKPAVIIDGTDFESSGAVVLKDSVKPVVFEAYLSAVNKIQLTAKKRKIFPRKVVKLPEQDFVMVQFVDLDLGRNNAWNDKISLDQTSFSILLDPLLVTVQDVYFSNENLKSGAVNYIYAEPKKNRIPIVFTKETTAEFFGIYTGLNGATTAIKAQLNSDLGKGILLSHKWRLRTAIDLVTSGVLIQTSIASDSANAIYNANQSLYGISGGGKFHLSENTSVMAELEVKKDLFFRRHDLTTGSIDVISGLNKDITISPSWSFYKTENATAEVKANFSYLLPTTADGEVISAGMAYGTELSYSYRISSSQIRLRSSYLRRQQSSDAFNFIEQTALYGVGYQYLF